MATPKLTKNWTITPNLRRVFASLIDLMGWFAYENLTALKAKGWTVKWTSDGTTGPANSADATDRITSAAAFATRATLAAAPQAYLVVQNADGVQLLIAYQGATDDVCRISYSEGGLFTLAGTTTHQPTATDEMLLSTGNSVVNATLSADRVMTVWATTESWACALYRSGGLQQFIGVEKFDSAIATAIKAQPYMCYRLLDTTYGSSNQGAVTGVIVATAFGAAGWHGAAVRHTFGGTPRVSKMNAPFGTNSGVSSAPTTNVVALNNQPAMQNLGAMPLIPIVWWGERTANLDGLAGTAFDWWLGYGITTSTPAQGDFFPGLEPGDAVDATPRTNWLVAIGAPIVRPWKNVAATLQTA